jgi:serine/threonine protein kinase
LGPVFRAYDAERERLVAVKLFKLDLPPDRVHRLVAQFEPIIAADLTHPAMAVPLAAGITGVYAYVAQDYVAAESLDLSVREYGPAPPVDALRVAAQLAGALDFAAVMNICHGALHPRDVLLSSDETRLTGVGVAHALEAIGVAAPVRRPYTAPERLAGRGWGRPADIFSLAALVHELLWGRRIAGPGPHTVDALTEIKGGDLAALKDTFARALAERPGDRFETALEFAEGLKASFPNVALTEPPKGRRRAPPVPRAERQPNPAGAPRPTAGDIAPRLPIDEPVLESGEWGRSGEARRSNGAARAVEFSGPDESGQAVESHESDETPAPVEVDDLMRPAEPPELPEPPIQSTVGSAPQVEDLDLRASTLTPADELEPSAVLEQSQSAVWPLMLALVVGLAIGFAGGYGFGVRERLAAPANVAPGRESTEVRVTEAPRSGSKPGPGEPLAAAPNPATAVRPHPPAAVATPGPTARDTTRSGASSTIEAPATAGSLLVRTAPPGAQVIIDGRDAGRSPLAVRDLAAGVHRIRLERDGYISEDRRVTVTRSRLAQTMSVALERANTASPASAAAAAAAARTTGLLTVDSLPTGARVFVDGRLLGTTPMAPKAVPIGDHAIRLELDGFKGWSSSVHVAGTEQSRVTASLER